MNKDITASSFLALRKHFFHQDGNPIPFKLRPKRITQDDPFDEHVAKVLSEFLEDINCFKAPGPLITPDMVLAREEVGKIDDPHILLLDTDLIVGVEVKKIDRLPSGSVARSSGLDYNTTPPCGTIRVYQSTEEPLDIRGYYLFVCLEPVSPGSDELIVTALALCDGNVLNEDFEYYLSITGKREKEIGIGTYKDGANRIRPMVIFANPLGASELDHTVTLIHPDEDLEASEPELKKIYTLRRNISDNEYKDFYCYRFKNDVPADWEPKILIDPFPTPANRTATTQARGMFRLPYRLRS